MCDASNKLQPALLYSEQVLFFLCDWSDILITLSRFRTWSIWVSYGWEDFVFGQSVVLRSSLCLNSFTNRMPSEYGDTNATRKNLWDSCSRKSQTSNNDHFHFSFELSKQEDQARDICPILLVNKSSPVVLDNFVPYSQWHVNITQFSLQVKRKTQMSF